MANEAFDMRKWLKDFIGGAPHKALEEYRLGLVAQYTDAIKAPLQNQEQIFLQEFNKGCLDILERDLAKEMLEEMPKLKQSEKQEPTDETLV